MPDNLVTTEESKTLETALIEQAGFLSPLAGTLAERWARLYLDNFGRGAFFSEKRVGKTFRELVENFIGCLKEGRIDAYLETLSEKGETFYRLRIPFEEVMISLYSFFEGLGSAVLL